MLRDQLNKASRPSHPTCGGGRRPDFAAARDPRADGGRVRGRGEALAARSRRVRAAGVRGQAGRRRSDFVGRCPRLGVGGPGHLLLLQRADLLTLSSSVPRGHGDHLRLELLYRLRSPGGAARPGAGEAPIEADRDPRRGRPSAGVVSPGPAWAAGRPWQGPGVAAVCGRSECGSRLKPPPIARVGRARPRPRPPSCARISRSTAAGGRAPAR